MWYWIKRLFGAVEDELTLAERHLAASQLGQDAVSAFHSIVVDLESAATDLKRVAEEAAAEAEALLQRKVDAEDEAAKHVNAAGKIRGLLG